MGSIIQMVATGTGSTENALASVDVPLNGTLEGVEWSVQDELDTTLDVAVWQVSFGSTYTSGNDMRQVISNVRQKAVILSAVGQGDVAKNCYTPLNVPVAAGERIYLHRAASASVAGGCFCLLHFSFNTPGGRR